MPPLHAMFLVSGLGETPVIQYVLGIWPTYLIGLGILALLDSSYPPWSEDIYVKEFRQSSNEYGHGPRNKSRYLPMEHWTR